MPTRIDELDWFTNWLTEIRYVDLTSRFMEDHGEHDSLAYVMPFMLAWTTKHTFRGPNALLRCTFSKILPNKWNYIYAKSNVHLVISIHFVNAICLEYKFCIVGWWFHYCWPIFFKTASLVCHFLPGSQQNSNIFL